MNDATAPARHWQQPLAPFGLVLTHPGYVRFAHWVTGTVPWFLVTTSATLTAAEGVAVFAARFRQEDGFRDPGHSR